MRIIRAVYIPKPIQSGISSILLVIFNGQERNRLLRWPDGNGPLDLLDDGPFREALRDRRPV